MRLGIDLGTTRTVAVAVDRGNLPVVGFSTPEGDVLDYYPTVTAELDGELVHGHDAEQAARQGAPCLRSWKRLLFDHGADDEVIIGTLSVTMLALATSFVSALRRDLGSGSNLPAPLDDLPEVAISVPANAHSTQRFVTLEAFRRAGFAVRAVINEPTAAGLEYAYRHGRTLTSNRQQVLIYDLGGGTFDAALVRMDVDRHDVLTTSGVARLGGDDFDEALLELALEQTDLARPSLTPTERGQLLMEARAAKEGISPNTRRVVLDLEALGERAPSEPVVLSVADFYERIRPLVVRTEHALDQVLGSTAADQSGATSPQALAGLYVVGGGSGLPLVPRVLRERFGRRVHRSPYPSAATAIGLGIAVQQTEGSSPSLTERFTHHLGVFREQETGARISFDGIFAPGAPLPRRADGPLTVTRRYRAAHNVGLFRYVECSAIDADGEPRGDITPYGTIRFPFSSDLQSCPSLDEVAIQRLPEPGPEIEERYEVDATGVVSVTIEDVDSRFSRRFVL
ncbi:MAG: Hsp70 family protein [Deltaproteobacteria bacterium]|jgi:molecular chaperone DnaK (HSP70)|nr:Hsp70 family protein [Deltaproteobacteria bacterium]MBW2536160.1 Hsp70 family protein [Deltaproteobacteria bacterium]